MNLTPSALLAHSRTDAGKRALRYVATSGFGVVTTQILLFLFLHIFEWDSLPSNFTAVTIVALPAFLLNKYWVWGKRGRPHMRREVLPFWVFTVAGWALSTGAVALASDHVGTPHSFVRTLAVMVASIAGRA